MKYILHVVFFLVVSCSQVASAQQTDENSEKENEKEAEKVVEFAEQYDQRFRKREPKIGSVLPDTEVFDEIGLPFDWQQTRGAYTVLVFGCLT